MGYYAGFKYGSGVLYGIQCDITSVDPIRGPSPGGNRFVMTGAGFDPRQWDDIFTSLTLDTSKWLDISSGGSVYTGPDHLRLATGVAAGSTAGVESTADWTDVQGEIRAILATPLIYPNEPVIVCRFCLWVSAATYACMYITMDTQGALRLHCETWVGSLKSDELKSQVSWSLGLCTLKILRYGSDVYFIANGSVVWSTVKFVTDAAQFRVTSENVSQDYDVNILKVEWFYYRSYAVFQNQPVHATVVVSDRRVRGLVPASLDIRKKNAAYEGLVDVSMVGITKAIAPSAYEYYFVKGLKVVNEIQFDVGLDVINDPQLETPEGERKGLGGGY